MNYTYSLECNCGFEDSINEGEGFVIAQCLVCNQYDSLERRSKYELKCLACGEKKIIPNKYEIKEETCEKCKLSGIAGFKEFQKDILFEMEVINQGDKKCKLCKSNRWDIKKDYELNCPRCKKVLKVYPMSKWENKNDS